MATTSDTTQLDSSHTRSGASSSSSRSTSRTAKTASTSSAGKGALSTAATSVTGLHQSPQLQAADAGGSIFVLDEMNEMDLMVAHVGAFADGQVEVAESELGGDFSGLGSSA